MTWDGIPEHRNLSGGDGEPPKPLSDRLRDFLGSAPAGPQMPADPFNGLSEPAIAQVAMIDAVREAGLPEFPALLYVACLVQVGLAIQRSGLFPPPEP